MALSTNSLLLLDQRTLQIKYRIPATEIYRLSLSPYHDNIAVFHVKAVSVCTHFICNCVWHEHTSNPIFHVSVCSYSRRCAGKRATLYSKRRMSSKWLPNYFWSFKMRRADSRKFALTQSKSEYCDRVNGWRSFRIICLWILWLHGSSSDGTIILNER